MPTTLFLIGQRTLSSPINISRHAPVFGYVAFSIGFIWSYKALEDTTHMKEYLQKLTDKPKIVAVIAETNQGKSNLLYHLVCSLSDGNEYELKTYGLRFDLGEDKLHSLGELETITNSVIICDEFQTLFDMDDRKNKRAIENSLRLIHHNNNILILAGLPDNFKKFLSNKVDTFIFKRCRIGSFINGSYAKAVCLQYRGLELGATVLNMAVNEALIYDGMYTKVTIPYLEKYDTKKDNVQIVRSCTKPPRKASVKN